ncbi:MAG: hypothetical protein MZW92_25535 [Comamonadaceae bacterium]|nr:hypothetical protein [Comamonadaceae bacterium]
MTPGKTAQASASASSGTTSSTRSRPSSAGYPAKRNWWPLSSDVYEEIMPSIGDAYPYPVKALFSYMGAAHLRAAGGPHEHRGPGRPREAPALLRERHPHRHDLDVRRLHLPRPALPGALGDAGLAPEHAGQGPADPAAGDRPDPPRR